MTLRVLFVDDEPNILQGLERMLRSMRNEWDMVFVESGQEALDELSKKPFDVVVSDMRMPGMDGAQLLDEVMNRYPKVTRFILSGHSDMEMIMKSVGPAHQYLSKPCSPDTLKAALHRASVLGDMLNNRALKQIVTQMRSLPSFPSLYFEIMEELQSPEASLKRIGRIISKDIGMSAKILQLVNSAFFGLPRYISSPANAAGLLGLDTLKALVLSVHIFSQVNREKLKAFPFDRLWHHSISVGGMASMIIKLETTDQKSIDDAIMAGLLHDTGKLILAFNFPEFYNEVLRLALNENRSFLEAEKEVFGSTHTEVGAYLLGLWGLPDTIVECVAFHHEPSRGSDKGLSALVAVHVANALDHEGQAQESGAPGDEIDVKYLANIGLADRLHEWRQRCQVMKEGEG